MKEGIVRLEVGKTKNDEGRIVFMDGCKKCSRASVREWALAKRAATESEGYRAVSSMWYWSRKVA